NLFPCVHTCNPEFTFTQAGIFYLRRKYLNMRIPSFLKNSLAISCICMMSFWMKAQCPDCTPDLSCSGSTNYPAVCPMTAEDATVGQYYEHTLTFYIPTNVTDPGTGISFTILSV